MSSAAPVTIRPATLSDLNTFQMPTERHFVRDHFGVVEDAPASIAVGGLTYRKTEISLAEIRRIGSREIAVVLECAGHRRSEHDPSTAGVPWQLGAVSEARWRGVPLRNLLSEADPTSAATHIIAHGADMGETAHGTQNFARALPMMKALHPDTMVAFEMNGQPIPAEHGGPLRLIVPGWYATDSVKWLTRLEACGDGFDGYFEAHDYRLQLKGETGPGARLGQLPPHALITSEQLEALPNGRLVVRGIAWGGYGGIRQIDVQVGESGWRRAEAVQSTSPYGRLFWQLELDPEGVEPVAISVRATDHGGLFQPDKPVWNAKGYRNNAVHTVSLNR